MPTPLVYSETGLTETLAAFKGLEADLRKEANAELRQAGRAAGTALAAELRVAAAVSGVPVAPRVARSITVKTDRLPTVSIGGSRKVGRRGAPAAVLVWGSERGPAGEPNHFGVPPSATGHWIAPAVLRFERGECMVIYKRALFELLRRYKLV